MNVEQWVERRAAQTEAGHRRRVEYFFSTTLALAITYIAHYQYRSQYSGQAQLTDVAAFINQFTCNIYAYRPLMRDAVLGLSEVAFEGNLYAARAALNGVGLLALNLAVAALGRRFQIRPSSILSIILQVDLLVLACLFVNANPYTVPMVALIYWSIALSEASHWPAALGVLVVAMLSHELAALGGVYLISKLMGSRQGWPDRSAILRNRTAIALTALAILIPYVGLRLLIQVPAACAPASPFFSRLALAQLTHWQSVLGLFFVVAIFAAYLNHAVAHRVVREGRAYILVFLAAAVPMTLYFALFAALEETRLFLSFFPMLVIVAAERSSANSGDQEVPHHAT